MQTQLKSLVLAALAAVSVGSFRADGGHFEGNGGDYIRATFLRMGQAVVDHLQHDPDGQALVQGQGLDVAALTATLSIDVVKVSDTPLLDNGGSQVDALGTPGHITLVHDAWADHLEKERDVYFLVFHEMLRAAGVADDNYVVSGHVRPFPDAERVPTSLGGGPALIAGDDVADLIDIAGLAVNGSGCPSGFGTLVDFDSARNVLGLRMEEFALSYSALAPPADARKACIVSLQTRALPAGKRLEATQIDLVGEVDLPVGAALTMTADAYLAGTLSQGAAQKTVAAAAAPVAGRTLLRSNATLLSSDCGAGPKLLNLAVSANAKAATAPEQAVKGRLIGVSLYLKLVDCAE